MTMTVDGSIQACGLCRISRCDLISLNPSGAERPSLPGRRHNGSRAPRAGPRTGSPWIAPPAPGVGIAEDQDELDVDHVACAAVAGVHIVVACDRWSTWRDS
jgi:hypothetical protein